MHTGDISYQFNNVHRLPCEPRHTLSALYSCLCRIQPKATASYSFAHLYFTSYSFIYIYFFVFKRQIVGIIVTAAFSVCLFFGYPNNILIHYECVVIKSRRVIWAVHAARLGELRNVHKISIRKPEGKRSLGRTRRRWEDNIRMDLR